jgi:hypothetical protein
LIYPASYFPVAQPPSHKRKRDEQSPGLIPLQNPQMNLPVPVDGESLPTELAVTKEQLARERNLTAHISTQFALAKSQLVCAQLSNKELQKTLAKTRMDLQKAATQEKVDLLHTIELQAKTIRELRDQNELERSIFRGQIQKLQMEKECLNEGLKDGINAVQQLQSRLHKANSDLQEGEILRNQIQKLNNEKADLQLSIANEVKKSKQLQETLDASKKVQDLKDQIQGLRKEKGNLQLDLRDKKDTIRQLQSDLDKASKDCLALKEQFKKLSPETFINTMKEEFLRGQIEKLKEEKSILEYQVDCQNAASAELRDNERRLRMERAERDQFLLSLINRNKQLEAEMATLKQPASQQRVPFESYQIPNPFADTARNSSNSYTNSCK